MNNELDIINEVTEQSAAEADVPEIFAEQLVEPADAAAELVADDDAAAAEAIAIALAAEEDDSAEPAEEACECCEAVETLAEEPCECCEAAEEACECCEAAEAVEAPAEDAVEALSEEGEEPVIAPVFDDDEEFVPAITFSDDYDDPVDDRDDDYYASNAARVRILLTKEAEKEAAEPVAAKKVGFGRKIANFFYHNKTALLVGAVAAALLVWMLVKAFRA